MSDGQTVLRSRKRRGPKPKPASELRGNRISVYLTDDELSALVRHVYRHQPEVNADAPGVRQQVGRYMRDATFNRLPLIIPAINDKAWHALAGVAENLNRYQVALQLGRAQGHPPELIRQLRDQVQALRLQLLGLDKEAVEMAPPVGEGGVMERSDSSFSDAPRAAAVCSGGTDEGQS